MNDFLLAAFAMTWIIGILAMSVSLVLWALNPSIDWGLLEVFLAGLTVLLSLYGMWRTGRGVF